MSQKCGSAGAVQIEESDPLYKLYYVACQQQPWLKVGGMGFEEGLLSESDYPFTLFRYESLEELETFLGGRNHAIRTGVVYRDIMMVNQIDGGGEWWTLKLDDGKAHPFESITFWWVVARGEFKRMMRRLTSASLERCLRFDY